MKTERAKRQDEMLGEDGRARYGSIICSERTENYTKRALLHSCMRDCSVICLHFTFPVSRSIPPPDCPLLITHYPFPTTSRLEENKLHNFDFESVFKNV